MAIPPNPATSNNNPAPTDPSRMGLLGGDLAGFPNGRRVFDNVTAVELRAIAGVTYPLVAPTYTPDGAAGQLTDGTTNECPTWAPSHTSPCRTRGSCTIMTPTARAPDLPAGETSGQLSSPLFGESALSGAWAE